MQIIPAQTVTSFRVSPDYSTGVAWRDNFLSLPGAGALRCGRVSFEPGARTAWHTHPLGQILHVLSGVGRVQRWGEPAVAIQAGDTVHIPAGEKHWHGAGPQGVFVHLFIQQTDGQEDTVWLEQVTDEEYGRAG